VVSSPLYDNGAVGTGIAHYVTPSAGGPIVATYATSADADVTLSAAQVSNILGTGTNLLLQANNDITVNTAFSATNGGSLTLQAGRSVLLNASLTTGNGDLTVIANDNLTNGVVDLYRDPGLATITMASGTALNAGSGGVSMELRPGTGKLFNASGAITLGSLAAGTINVVNQGPTAGSNVILRSGATLTATGKRHQHPDRGGWRRGGNVYQSGHEQPASRSRALSCLFRYTCEYHGGRERLQQALRHDLSRDRGSGDG